jgi:hypothetical protein
MQQHVLRHSSSLSNSSVLPEEDQQRVWGVWLSAVTSACKQLGGQLQ